MTNIPINMKTATRLLLVAMILVLAFGTLSFVQGYRYKSPDAWSFGVHGDTQWTLDGNLADNPNYVAVAMIKKLNDEFIKRGVKFVIQTGDLTDRAGAAALVTRVEAADSLYEARIGFFPLRGNHETLGASNKMDPYLDCDIVDFKDSFPQTIGEGPFTFDAGNFSSPVILKNGSSILDRKGNPVLKGLSYSFDYNDARFILIDAEGTAITGVTPPPAIHPIYGQGYYYAGIIIYKATATVPGGDFKEGEWFLLDASGNPTKDWSPWRPDLYPPDIWAYLSSYSVAGSEYLPDAQQTWISDQLSKTAMRPTQAFVFSHRPIINENHVDSLFGATAGKLAANQNTFFASLQDNDVKFMISGHDHLYNRALDKSPDLKKQVQQIITQGASTKFYTPSRRSSFWNSLTTINYKDRETQISQEVNNFGYYIYAVDGQRVTAGYYSDAVGNFTDGTGYPDGSGSLKVPAFDFIKQDEWGYSLDPNATQTVVAQGASYVGIGGSFAGTTATILAGTNNSTSTDQTPLESDVKFSLPPYFGVNGPRPLNKVVNTGWVEKPANNSALASNIFSLWGMTEFGKSQSDVYVLQMSFKDERPNSKNKVLGNGGYRLAAIDAKSNWINAVELNLGTQKQKFVKGPYNSSYGLGTYGIDMNNNVVWAVINYDADFAVAKF